MAKLVNVDRPQTSLIRLTLNNPRKRNALDSDMRNDLIGEFRAAIADEQARAIILTGAGATFCAGGDIASMGTLDEHGGMRRMTLNHELVRILYHCQKPVICALEGAAMGAGAGLALLCDIIVAGENAHVGFPFFKLGIIPDYGLLHTLPLRVGIAQARMLLLRSDAVNAKRAKELGLVDFVYPDFRVQDEAAMIALEMGAQPRFAFGMAKNVLGLFPMAFDQALAVERTAQVGCFLSNDHDEGVAAYREQRKAEF